MSRERGPYHDPYANLAAAILADGVRHHDTEFLKSDWCNILKRMCALDDEMYCGRDCPQRRSMLLKTRGGYNLEFN